MPVIPEFGRLGQENHKFETTLGCIARSCLKKMAYQENPKGLWVLTGLLPTGRMLL
jgi:hypothetical protein